ncbi:unnamed protein product [Phytophthora lilii]|uniref:Unnamed protein product n=1 Tax=Phytophthora lilii TaxID=2077276 RepID=A0A9W6XD46_9STRA|nr:unnamed protein product [Phytophthora lilii]
MVKLFCAIVGVAGSAFSVRVDESDLVDDLKDAIKAKNPATITCDAKDLQLFLAKTEGGAWLDGAGAAAVALDERGGHPQGCVQMDPLLWLKNVKYFGDSFQPGEGQVHVLVVVPGHVRVDIGRTASKALKYKRTRWVVNVQCFVPVILAVITIIVLAFGENPTDEKGCLTVLGRSLIVCQMIGVDIAVGAILSYSQHWKSKPDNMIEEAKDETPLQAQRQEMTDLTFAAEAQHQELTEHTSLLPATEAQRQPQQQQPSQSTKRKQRKKKEEMNNLIKAWCLQLLNYQVFVDRS